jgi:hypothetical protein
VHVVLLDVLRHVRVLDLSFPSNALKKDTKLNVCVPALLSFVVPCLQEIDLSSAYVTEPALRYFAYKCPVLEKVTWNNHQANMHMSGNALSGCNHLKEIYMNDSVFTYHLGESQAMRALSEQWVSYSIFFHCNANLVRVSLKNAKCREKDIFASPEFPRKRFPRLVLSSSFGTLQVCVGSEAT